MKIENIAMVCHEVNRAYCAALGDDSQQSWGNCPQWQRESAKIGVALHMAKPEAGPAASHESWLAEKERDGWKYGEVKDANAKTHPCFMPFKDLPREQQAKDFIFRAIVLAIDSASDRNDKS